MLCVYQARCTATVCVCVLGDDVKYNISALCALPFRTIAVCGFVYVVYVLYVVRTRCRS